MTAALTTLPAAASPLAIPAEFAAKLDAALASGIKDAKQFASEHSPAERWMVPEWALLRMDWPPKDDAEDLKYLYGVAKTRTPEGIEKARYWAKHGLTEEWEKLLEDYTKRASPSQARAARKLLHDALMMVNNVTQTAKAAAARKRPFVVDPKIPLAVDKPGNNPSYPSGHTSAAFAACLVLSHLMPDRRAEFMSMAKEASWARVYSAVHFPTDVVAGVRLATTVVDYLNSTSAAQPITGSSTTNPGVAGGRVALPGSTALAGAALAAAGRLAA